MTARPQLSIALASYNGERYISEQLDSIMHQTRLPDELIISDDASVDATRDIIADFTQHAPFPVRILTNDKRLGSTRNFEMAIRACRGEIIFLCDQDDVWYPEKIAVIEACFMRNPGTGIVFTDADAVDENLNPLGLRLWKAVRFSPRDQAQVAALDAFSVLLKRYIVTGATMAFRSTYRDLVLPFSDIWIHDAWIAMLIGATTDVTALPVPLIAYRQHSGNQIGIRRAKSQGITCSALYGPKVLRYEAALARLLESMNRFPENAYNTHRLNEVLTFLRVRAALPQTRWRRLPDTLRELVLLRYHRYAYGWKSLRKDLLR